MGKRDELIDSYVTEAVTGRAAPRREIPSGTPRSASKRSKWERAGMTRSEYERAIPRLVEERNAKLARQARLDRARRGQSNPGNN